MTDPRAVRVFKTRRRVDMYLYVDAATDPETLPEGLLKAFGQPIEALAFDLTPDRVLARADARDVLSKLDEDGFYLQMPPSIDGTD